MHRFSNQWGGGKIFCGGSCGCVRQIAGVHGGGSVSLVRVSDPPLPPCPPGPLSSQGSIATGHACGGIPLANIASLPAQAVEHPNAILEPPTPLGAFGPFLLGGGGVAYKSKETAHPWRSYFRHTNGPSCLSVVSPGDFCCHSGRRLRHCHGRAVCSDRCCVAALCLAG